MFFEGLKAPRFHLFPRACGAALVADAFAFRAKAGSLVRGRKREPLGSRKTGSDKGGFSPGSLPAARISAEVRETAANELKRLTARTGMSGRALRVQG
jgi:hypothetical protein